MLRNLTARLSNTSDKKWGTAWLAGPRLAITAAHLLKDDAQRGDSVTLEFPQCSLDAHIIWLDRTLDAALLKTAKSLGAPGHGFRLARLLAAAAGGESAWTAFGFPAAHPEGLTITGSISSTNGIEQGIRVLELACFQGVGASALNGMSGSAVCINNSCIGIIVCGPPKLEQRVIFAVPIETVCQKILESRCLDSKEEADTFDRLSTLELDPFDTSFSHYLAAVHEVSSRLPQQLASSPGVVRHLEEVYIPLRLRHVQFNECQIGTLELCALGDRDCPVLSLQSAIQQAQQSSEHNVFFFGDPGSGKSSLLQFIAGRAWDSPGSLGLDRRHIPMLVRLGHLSEVEGSLEDWLWNGMCRACKPTIKPPNGYFLTWPERTGAPWLLLLDGFDEVPKRLRDSMLGALSAAVNCEKYRCFLTSRPAQGRRDKVLSLCNTATCYELLPLNGEQEGLLVSNWLADDAIQFRAQFEAIPLNDSKKTPLLLTIAASVYQNSGKLPDSRTDLYRELVEESLEEALKKGLEKEMNPRAAALRSSILERIALNTTEHQLDATLGAAVRCCANYLKDALAISRDEALIIARESVMALGRYSGVFFCDDEKCYWSHNTIREYLAANLLAQSASKERLFEVALLWDQEPWPEVILFLFSLLTKRDDGETDPVDLTKALAQHVLDAAKPADGVAALFLAAAWAEGAALSPPLTDALIWHLHGSIVQAAEKRSGKSNDHCAEFYDELQGRGRSPIDLLGRLSRWPAAAAALIDVVADNGLKEWARKSAALACLRAGMHDQLRHLLASKKIERALAQNILAAAPKTMNLVN